MCAPSLHVYFKQNFPAALTCALLPGTVAFHQHLRSSVQGNTIPVNKSAFDCSNNMIASHCDNIMSHATKFPNALPIERLGRQHPTLDSFNEAVHGAGAACSGKKPLPGRKHFSLVIVTDRESPSCRRILLGMKHRGFGKGLYNSFGGKIDPTDPCPAAAAVRELHEEANILVPLGTMKCGAVGTIHFTFDEEEFEMMVHLFLIDLRDFVSDEKERKRIELEIRGCEEITPEWMDDWRHVPLNQMFADDSIWLPLLLESEGKLEFDGYFHFMADPQITNTVLDWFIDVNTIMGRRNTCK